MFNSDFIPSVEIKKWLETNGYKPVYTSVEPKMPNNMYLVTEYGSTSDEFYEEANVQIYHRNTDYSKGYNALNKIKKDLLASDLGYSLTVKSGVIPIDKKDGYYDFSLNIILYKEAL